MIVINTGSTGGGGGGANTDGSNITSPATWRTNLDVLESTETRRNSRMSIEPGITLDGATSGTKIFQSYKTQLIASGDFSVWIRFRVPTSLGGANRWLYALSSSNTSAASANGFAIYLGADTNLFAQFYGATTSDYRNTYVSGFHSAYAGKVVDIVFTRTGTTTAWYVNGAAVSTSSAIVGTAPAFSNSIVNDYGWAGALDSTQNLFGGSYHRLALFNRCLSSADVLSLVIYGIDPSDQWGSQTGIVTGADSTFASDSGFWTKVSATIAAGVCTLSAGGTITRSASLAVGRRYRCTATTLNNSGAVRMADGVTYQNSITTNTTTVLEFVSTGANFNLANTGAGSADVDDVSLVRIGAVMDLDFSIGGGSYIPDESGNLIYGDVTGGYVYRVPCRGGVITWTFPLSNTDISSTASTTRLGDLPAGWSVARNIIDRKVAFDASTTINVGHSSQTSIANAVSVTTATYAFQNGQTLTPFSSTAASTVYIKKNQVTTVGSLVWSLIIEVAQ